MDSDFQEPSSDGTSRRLRIAIQRGGLSEGGFSPSASNGKRPPVPHHPGHWSPVRWSIWPSGRKTARRSTGKKPQSFVETACRFRGGGVVRCLVRSGRSPDAERLEKRWVWEKLNLVACDARPHPWCHSGVGGCLCDKHPRGCRCASARSVNGLTW